MPDNDRREEIEAAERPEERREGGTATKTRPSPPQRKNLPPYRVLLHNDSVSDMGEVVDTICDLTPLKRQDAVTRMLEAHNTGVALLLVTHKERAELYREQFHSKRLKVSIEAAD